MAYGFTSKADNAVSATGVNIPVNITVSAGDTLLVVWGGFTGTLTSFTPADGTHTYVSASAAGAVVSTLTHRIATYYVINPTPGTYTITATLGATRANRRILAATYSGITAFQAAQPQGQVGAATTTDAVSTSNMTPSSQPALLTAVSFTANGTATYTAGTGHTSRGALTNWDAIGSFSSLFEDIRLTSTSAVSGLFTIGTSRDTLSSGAIFTEIASYSLAADAGSYALSGTDAALKFGRVLPADGGTYALSGTDAALKFNRVLSAASGSYSLSGLDATLTYTPIGAYTLTADAGSYSLTGGDASLLFGRVLTADSSGGATYSLTGGDASLLRGYSLQADAASYTLSGLDATLTWTQTSRTLTAEEGTYSLTGGDATLTYSGASVGAGRGSRGVAVELHGRIHYFDSEEEAENWLAAQMPAIEKRVKKAAKRIARASVNALKAEPFIAPIEVIGPPVLQTFARVKLAALETMFNAQVRAEKRRIEDEEEEAAALLLM